MIETAMRNGSHFFEWIHSHSEGTPFLAEVLLTRMEQKGQVSLQATVRDIKERKLADEKLLEKEETLKLITESANDAIIIMNNRGIITFWNTAASSILGYSKEEAVGENLHELIAL
jgi:PAS domain-containing protein